MVAEDMERWKRYRCIAINGTPTTVKFKELR